MTTNESMQATSSRWVQIVGLAAFVLTQFQFAVAQDQKDEIVLRAAVGERLSRLLELEGTMFPKQLWPAKWENNVAEEYDSLENHPVLIVTITDWLPTSQSGIEIAQKLKQEFGESGLKVIGIRNSISLPTNGDAPVADIPIGLENNENSLREFLHADADPNFYLMDRAGVIRYADVDVRSLRTAVGSVNNENLQSAQSRQTNSVSEEPNTNARADSTFEKWGVFVQNSFEQFELRIDPGRKKPCTLYPSKSNSWREMSDQEVRDGIAIQSCDYAPNSVEVLTRKDRRDQFQARIRVRLDDDTGLGVGVLMQKYVMNGNSREDTSDVLLQRLPQKEDEPMKREWLKSWSPMGRNVVTFGEKIEFPKRFGFLLEPVVPEGVSVDVPASPEELYENADWPLFNQEGQEAWAKGINDVQGIRTTFKTVFRKPSWLVPDAGKDLFVNGKMTLLMATGSLKSFNALEDEAILDLLTRYQHDLNVVIYVGGSSDGIDNVPVTFRKAVFVDPENELLRSLNSSTSSDYVALLFSTDGLVRWQGRMSGTRSSRKPVYVAIVGAVTADPGVQSRRRLEGRSETSSPEDLHLWRGPDIQWDWRIKETHPLQVAFRAGQEPRATFTHTDGRGKLDQSLIIKVTDNDGEQVSGTAWIRGNAFMPGGGLARLDVTREFSGVINSEKQNMRITWGNVIGNPPKNVVLMNEPEVVYFDSSKRGVSESGNFAFAPSIARDQILDQFVWVNDRWHTSKSLGGKPEFVTGRLYRGSMEGSNNLHKMDIDLYLTQASEGKELGKLIFKGLAGEERLSVVGDATIELTSNVDGSFTIKIVDDGEPFSGVSIGRIPQPELWVGSQWSGRWEDGQFIAKLDIKGSGSRMVLLPLGVAPKAASLVKGSKWIGTVPHPIDARRLVQVELLIGEQSRIGSHKSELIVTAIADQGGWMPYKPTWKLSADVSVRLGGQAVIEPDAVLRQGGLNRGRYVPQQDANAWLKTKIRGQFTEREIRGDGDYLPIQLELKGGNR